MANNGTECPDPDDPLCPPEFPGVEPGIPPMDGIVQVGHTLNVSALLGDQLTLLTQLSVMTQALSVAMSVMIDASLSNSAGAAANLAFTTANTALQAQILLLRTKHLAFYLKYGPYL